MDTTKTLLIVKPDAVAGGLVGKIVAMAEERSFKILDVKMFSLSLSDASVFYNVHRDKPFFESLVKYMSSGPIAAFLLEKDDAVKAMRELVGLVDPAESAEGTIRKLYGVDIQHNAVHAPDSIENAQREIGLVFGRGALQRL
ncbi:MAG: nucleoside-diphosphate kinase [Candidatus Eiseniibacteriota bacterium]|nr:MAG: nucleoside-diphosphate kinase [Candidatus Eisenbacteria bacterium]